MSNISTIRERFEAGSIETVPESGANLSSEDVVNTSALKAKWETFVAERHKRQNSVVSSASSVVSQMSTDSSKTSHKTRSHSKSLTELPPTEEEKADGVITKLKCRLYRLDNSTTAWVDLGSGYAMFQRDSGSGLVNLKMRDKKTDKLVMHHLVHPQILLKENPGSNRSWVWRTTDGAHLEDGQPTVQTFAIKFKHAPVCAMFKTRYDEYRVVNEELNAGGITGPGRATNDGKEGDGEIARESAVEQKTGTATSPQPSPTSSPVLPPPVSPAHSAHSLTAPSPSPSHRHNSVSALNSGHTRSATRKNFAMSAAVGRRPMGVSGRAVVGGAHVGGLKKMQQTMKQSKLLRMLGTNLPHAVLQEQIEKQYEPSNSLASAFPRTRALRLAKHTSDSLLTSPVAPTADLDTCQSQIRVLNTVEELVALDQFIFESMLNRLKEENAALRNLARGASGEASGLLQTFEEPTAPATDPPEEGAGDATALQPLSELARVNTFFHQQVTSVTLALENLRRGHQFHVKGRKLRPRKRGPNLNQHRTSVINRLVCPSTQLMTFTKVKDPPTEETKVETIMFKITKVNRIRKNTPRVLELDIGSCQLRITKKTSVDDGSGFTSITIGPDSFISCHLSHKSDVLLDLSFQVPEKGGSTFSTYRGGGGKATKVWKVIFESRTDRDRCYRLLMIHMAPHNQDTPNQNSSKHNDNLRKESTYMPMPVRFNQKVKFKVRQLPVQRLATELHSMWLEQKLEDGWQFGPQVDEPKHTHPCVLPFDQLPPPLKAHYENDVIKTIGFAIAIGFSVDKRLDVDEDDDGDNIPQSMSHAAVDKDIVQLVNFLAQNSHDTWAEKRMSEGWTYGDTFDAKQQVRTDPKLVEWKKLDEDSRDLERNVAYKVLGSLLDWGYSVKKTE